MTRIKNGVVTQNNGVMDPFLIRVMERIEVGSKHTKRSPLSSCRRKLRQDRQISEDCCLPVCGLLVGLLVLGLSLSLGRVEISGSFWGGTQVWLVLKGNLGNLSPILRLMGQT